MGAQVQGWIMNQSGEALDDALEILELKQGGRQLRKRIGYIGGCEATIRQTISCDRKRQKTTQRLSREETKTGVSGANCAVRRAHKRQSIHNAKISSIENGENTGDR